MTTAVLNVRYLPKRFWPEAACIVTELAVARANAFVVHFRTRPPPMTS